MILFYFFLDNINGDGLYTLLFYDSYLILLKNKKLYYFLNLKYKLSENENNTANKK